MDMNLLRGLITAVSLACFVGIAIWAYAPRNKARFDEDARLPFQD
jgi:cytochrome c oxidase cbb3-type subunit 4